MSQVFKQVRKLFKIQKATSSAYHPESNGSLERSHKVLVEYLRCFCAEKQSEWERWIPFAIFVYNTTPHTATKFTPFELVYGSLANLPGALQKAPTSPLCNYEDFLLNTKYKMQVTHEIARKNLIKDKEEQKEKFDNKKANHVDFKEGTEVLLSNDASEIGVSKKLSALWIGPYKIVRANEIGTLALQYVGKKNSKCKTKLQTVHANRVKPYFSSSFQDESFGLC